MVYKVVTIIVLLIMAISTWFLLTNVYHIDIANNTLNEIKKYPVGSHIATNILDRTNLGIFYIFVFLSLVFIPGPLEITYLAILATTTNPFLALIATVAGIVVGQLINYGIGHIFSRFTKPNEKLKEKIDKYGAWFVFGAAILPFVPSQLVNFFAGTVKFQFKKWLIVVIIGNVLYFTILTLAATKLIAFFA